MVKLFITYFLASQCCCSGGNILTRKYWHVLLLIDKYLLTILGSLSQSSIIAIFKPFKINICIVNEIAMVYIMEYLQIFEYMIMKHININKWHMKLLWAVP